MSGPNEEAVGGTVPHVERRLAAILSADVKGYSRLMGNNDVATVETLTAYREVLTQLIGEQRGRVVDAPGDEHFTDGITNDIITDLSRIAELTVIARSSTFTYKGTALKIPDVGRELGVRTS